MPDPTSKPDAPHTPDAPCSPDAPCTIAGMLDATVARCGDQPALGVIDGGELRWRTWNDVNEMVAEALEHGFPPTEACGELGVAAHLAAQRRAAAEGQLAASVPTSGTSGEPRTVALSHANLVSNTIAVAETIAASVGQGDAGDGAGGDEIRLSFLPFHHLYARVCDLYCWVYRGSRMVLAESRDTIFRDCGIAQPTTINGVPYFLQKAVDVADRRGVSLRELLGGRIKRCYSGGAALSADLQRRYADEGVPLMNGYGLSEASPVVTVSTVKNNRPGTVGKPLPGVDVRIADASSETPGEVLVRGPNVMLGYAASGVDSGGGIDQAATAEVIRNGWLHTGDLGRIDDEGYLSIVGRKKEMLALATGKKVAPSRVEALLAASPWIEQVAVVGEGRNRLGALIVPNPDRVRAEVRRRRLWVWSKRRALAHPAIRELFANEITQTLAGAAPEEQVCVFTLIGRALDADRGEITAKLSLRRPAIEQNFGKTIDQMYRTAAKERRRPIALGT